MSLVGASTWTTSSGDEHTNHEAAAIPFIKNDVKHKQALKTSHECHEQVSILHTKPYAPSEALYGLLFDGHQTLHNNI